MGNHSDEEIIRAIEAAPTLVKEAVSSMSTLQAIAAIGKKYTLHVDLIGKLARLNTCMLVGLTSPTEALGELVLVGIPTDSSKSILGELNQSIFLPLQQRMRETGSIETIPEARVPAVPLMHVAQSLQPTSAQQSSVQTQSEATPPFNLIQPQAAQGVVPAPVPAPTSPVSAAPQPFMRTMAHDMDALQHSQNVINPSHIMPASSFQTASVPFHAPVQQVQAPVAAHILPGSVPPTPLPTPPPTPLPAAPLPPAIPAARPPAHDAIVREYGSDPYREPI